MAAISNKTESWSGHTFPEVESHIKLRFDENQFEEGDGTYSAIQKGNLGKVYGDYAIAEGISFYDPENEYNISLSSTDDQIITAWGTYIGDDDHEHQKFTLVKGEAAHAEGNNGLALGDHSHVEGNGCIAGNNSSHAEGTGSKAMGKYSHAEGLETEAIGTRSHTEGNTTIAYNKEGHAEGLDSIAGINTDGVSEWDSTITYAVNDQVIYSDHLYTCVKSGKNKKPSGSSTYWRREEAQHAEGKGTLASARASHAEGSGTQSTNLASHSEGTSTVASNEASHAEGGSTTAAGKYSHAEGKSTITNDWASHVEGFNTETGGNYIENTKSPDTDHIVGQMSHAEGNSTIAKGNSSHSEGVMTFASGEGSHAEGIYDGSEIIVQREPVVGSFESATTESRLYKTTTYNAAADEYEVGMKLISYSQTGSRYYMESQNITITAVYGNGSKWIQLSQKLGIGDLETIYNVVFAKDTTSTVRGAFGEGSHTEGINTITLNPGEHAEGYNNVSHIDKTIHSVGIGQNSLNKNAIEILNNGLIFIYGLNGYDGTNIDTTSDGNSLQAALKEKGFSIDNSFFDWDVDN